MLKYLLESLNSPAYKIASFEINHIPLLQYAAKQGLPLIVSTGMATTPEIKEAVETIYGVNVKNVSVLNVKGKVKRNQRGISRKPSWKKAYVRIEDGQDIDFSEVN